MDMVDDHIRTITELINGIMVPGLGSITDDKLTPELERALGIFLPVSL